MEKNKKNEELQSRREFFKKAAKGALPILSAIALAGMPGLMKAEEYDPTGCSFCRVGCSGDCTTSCLHGCQGCRGCEGTCKGACRFTCEGSCRGTCQGGCTNSCYGAGY